FFSSRRRHTRSKRDWSSDVCSSDLVFLIGGGTFAMGLLPSYAVAGGLGAVLLILLRLVQGIGIGGEYGGGSLLALENAPKSGRRSEERRVGKLSRNSRKRTCHEH